MLKACRTGTLSTSSTFLTRPIPVDQVGYYRFVKGRLNWGSQTSLTDALPAWQRLFAAAKAKKWFAPLLRV